MLHNYFFRTIGPAIYGGGVSTPAESNWAQEMALILSGSETDVWAYDFIQEAHYIDNQTTPAYSSSGAKTKGRPFTNDAVDYLGLAQGIWSYTTNYTYDNVPWVLGPNGYFERGAGNLVSGSKSATAGAGASIGSDAETAPDGSTPELITITASSNNYVYYDTSYPSVSFNDFDDIIAHLWVKDIDQQYIQITVSAPTTGGNRSYCNFDISNGTRGDYESSYHSASDYSIEAVTDGYYKISCVCRGNYANSPNSIDFLYIYGVDSNTAARADNASTTGGTFYAWRAQIRYRSWAEEYIENNYGNLDDEIEYTPFPTCDVTGERIGTAVVGSTIPNSITDWGSGSSFTNHFAGGIHDIENSTYWTKTNCTATGGQASPMVLGDGTTTYDIATLLTPSSAGGTGTVQLEAGFVNNGYDYPTAFRFLVKAGGADYMHIGYSGTAAFGAGYTGDVRWYIDLTTLDANREHEYLDYYATYGEDPDAPNIYSSYNFTAYTDCVVSRVNSDWIYIVFWTLMSPAGGGWDANTLEIGPCNAMGSKTCNLDGTKTLTILPSVPINHFTASSYIRSLGYNIAYPFEPDMQAKAFVDIPVGTENELTDGAWSFMYEFMGGSGRYLSNRINSNTSYLIDGQYNPGTFNVYGATSSGNVGASTTAYQSQGDFFVETQNFGRYALAHDDAVTYEMAVNGHSYGTDTSPGTQSTSITRIDLGTGLWRRAWGLNRTATMTELKTLSGSKTPSTRDTFFFRALTVDVLCTAWPPACLDVNNVAVQVLRSTAGT
jgi:hypothetical protein